MIEEGCRIYKELMNSGVIKLTTGWGDMAAALNNGDVASIVSGCWIVPTITAQEDQSGLWEVTRMPRLNIEQGTIMGIVEVPTGLSWNMQRTVISRRTF